VRRRGGYCSKGQIAGTALPKNDSHQENNQKVHLNNALIPWLQKE